MVVESDDPAGSRELRYGGFDPPGLLDRDNPECIGEREVCVGVRIQQDKAQSVIPVRRQHHRKDFGPQGRQRP
jgi:hypothetical protein